MASQPIRPNHHRGSAAGDVPASRERTVVLMPFEDAEEERLWDEIMEQRAKRS